MATDLKLDLVTMALVIENGDLVLVAENAEIQQSLVIELQLLIKTWFLDNRKGIDIFNKVLGKKPKITEKTATNEIKRVIKNKEGVTDITAFSFTETDPVSRKITVTFSVKTIYGVINDISVILP